MEKERLYWLPKKEDLWIAEENTDLGERNEGTSWGPDTMKLYPTGVKKYFETKKDRDDFIEKNRLKVRYKNDNN